MDWLHDFLRPASFAMRRYIQQEGWKCSQILFKTRLLYDNRSSRLVVLPLFGTHRALRRDKNTYSLTPVFPRGLRLPGPYVCVIELSVAVAVNSLFEKQSTYTYSPICCFGSVIFPCNVGELALLKIHRSSRQNGLEEKPSSIIDN